MDGSTDLAAYAGRILAETGVTVAQLLAGDLPEGEGAAVEALRDGDDAATTVGGDWL